jgi:hypothetical protein
LEQQVNTDIRTSAALIRPLSNESNARAVQAIRLLPGELTMNQAQHTDRHSAQAADIEHLGQLAARFRETRDELLRRRVVEDYARTVARLIESGDWHEVPPPECQLPDECMPREFFEYWQELVNEFAA